MGIAEKVQKNLNMYFKKHHCFCQLIWSFRIYTKKNSTEKEFYADLPITLRFFGLYEYDGFLSLIELNTHTIEFEYSNHLQLWIRYYEMKHVRTKPFSIQSSEIFLAYLTFMSAFYSDYNMAAFILQGKIVILLFSISKDTPLKTFLSQKGRRTEYTDFSNINIFLRRKIW